MYHLTKTLVIAGAHKLSLPYDSACQNFHGHNWKITVHCATKQLNESGMVVDFKLIKDHVMKYDHTNLNDSFQQPTAEHMAKRLTYDIPKCWKVEVEESPGSVVSFETPIEEVCND